jgi:glycosyltransferase domain-containing protein
VDNSYTLVILTFNRPTMVEALLAFLSLSKPCFRVLVLDHGNPISQEENRRVIAKTAFKAEHLSFPDSMDLRDVLCGGLSAVASEFVSIFPDDDIPNIQGIEDSVQYLASHPDYVAAQGYVLSFTERQRHLFIHHVEDYVPSYVGKDPLSRLLALSRRYQPIFHAVYRAEVLKWSHSRLSQLSTSNIMFQEFFHASLVALKGNIARVPKTFMLRRITGSYIDRRRLHCLHQLIDNPVTLASDYAYFRDQLLNCYYSDALGDKSIVSPKDAARIIDLIHMLFLGRHFDGSYVEHELSKILDEPGRSYFDCLPPQDQDLEPESVFQIIDLPTDNTCNQVSMHNNLIKLAETNDANFNAVYQNEIAIITSDLTSLAKHVRMYNEKS